MNSLVYYRRSLRAWFRKHPATLLVIAGGMVFVVLYFADEIDQCFYQIAKVMFGVSVLPD